MKCSFELILKVIMKNGMLCWTGCVLAAFDPFELTFCPFWIALLTLLNWPFDPFELHFWRQHLNCYRRNCLYLIRMLFEVSTDYQLINQSLYQSINPNQSIESLIDIKVNLSYLKECAEFPLYVRMFKLLSGFVVDCENYTKDDGSFCPVEGMPLLFDRYEYVEVIGQGQSSILLKAKASSPRGLCTCSLTDSLFVIIWQQFLYLTKNTIIFNVLWQFHCILNVLVLEQSAKQAKIPARFCLTSLMQAFLCFLEVFPIYFLKLHPACRNEVRESRWVRLNLIVSSDDIYFWLNLTGCV